MQTKNAVATRTHCRPIFKVIFVALQGFGLEAKTRGGIIETEENKGRSRHNVEGSFLCVLYFGWPNQPSSGTMIILHWYVILMLHVV